MSTINSVPKIYRLGERHTNGIFNGLVVVEEKYDGSQFTFGVVDGELICRSKGAILNQIEPGMFKPVVDKAIDLFAAKLLPEGNVYLCEFLAKPKHNVLAYARVPAGFLVLYDVQITSQESDSEIWNMMDVTEKQAEAVRLGLEPVRVLFSGDLNFDEQNKLSLLHQTESSLGVVNIEGIVIKNYDRSHPERPKWPMTAKLVSDVFKEKQTLKPRNPKAGPGEFVQAMVNSLRTENRWLKAVQHLKEAGTLTNENSDIGLLFREVQGDILAEETEWIKQKLFDEFSKEVLKGAVQGLAQWYQNKLASGWSVFEETEILKTNT